MPDLDFHVERIEAEKHTVTPLLTFHIGITQGSAPVAIQTIALHCQIRVDPAGRKYDPGETKRLYELFGHREQWGQTLRSMLWTHASTMVGGFDTETVASLPVPCTFDFNVAMTKYFDALEGGEVPLSLLFSGTIFYLSPAGHLQTAPISWEKEATARLPVSTWQDMMRHHYPNTAWLCLNKDLFDRLHRCKVEAGHVSWDNAIDALLQSVDQKVTP